MEANLLKEIKTLEGLIKKCADTHRMSDSERLNRTQIQILTYLIRHEDEEICQKDLENETGLKKASITGALDSLEDKQAIVRLESNIDRRRNVIVLADRAIRYRNELEKVYEDINKNIARGISDEELSIFLQVIEKIKKNIEEKM